jgi:hypothetical protein
VLLSVCSVALQRVLQLIVLQFRSRDANALEIVVLRREVAILPGRSLRCDVGQVFHAMHGSPGESRPLLVERNGVRLRIAANVTRF